MLIVPAETNDMIKLMPDSSNRVTALSEFYDFIPILC